MIIADEICNRALQFTNPGELLGLVMAHEIGHLLLSEAHSVKASCKLNFQPILEIEVKPYWYLRANKLRACRARSGYGF